LLLALDARSAPNELWCEMLELWCEMFELWCEMLELWCEMLELWCKMLELWCEMLELWCEPLIARTGDTLSPPMLPHAPIYLGRTHGTRSFGCV